MLKKGWKPGWDGQALRASLQVWAVTLLVYSLLGLAAWAWFSPIRPADPQKFWGTTPLEEGAAGALLGVWLRWDAIHYLKIAQAGYSEEMLSAFFPFYPLLGHGLGRILGGSDLAGLLAVSRLALLGVFYFLHRITTKFFDPQIAQRTLILCAFFPTSVYLLAPYPLSLALLFSLAAVWWGLQARWLPAALAGLCAGLTHGTTLPLAAGLGVIALQQIWKERRHWPVLAATLTPLLGTGLFLAWRVAQGLPDFAQVMFKYWFRISQPPWMVVADFQRFFTAYTGHADGWVNLTLFLAALVLTVLSVRRLPASLWVYQLTGLIFLCSTAVLNTPFGSTGRYLLIMFPLYMESAALPRGRVGWLALLGVSLFAALFLAMVYFMWGWLA